MIAGQRGSSVRLVIALTALLAALGMAAPAAAEFAGAESRGASSCSETELDERLKVTFVGPAAADAGSTLAVKWTGREAVRLSAWIDVDADGAWHESERVVAAAELSPGIGVFDLEVPPRGRIDQDTRLRLRLDGDGPARESVRPLFGTSGGGLECGFAPGFNGDGTEACGRR